MTVGAAAMEPSSPASMTQRATSPTTTRRRSKNTYRTRRRMSLGTIWISIMCTTHGTSRVGQYNTGGVAEVGQAAPSADDADFAQMTPMIDLRYLRHLRIRFPYLPNVTTFRERSNP